MDMVAVPGAGSDVADLPLPAFDPEREPILLGLGGTMSPDDESADPIARITSAVATADRIATMTAAFRDELVARVYREGAAEYAARLTHLPPAERREWGAQGMLSELACALRILEQTLARRREPRRARRVPEIPRGQRRRSDLVVALRRHARRLRCGGRRGSAGCRRLGADQGGADVDRVGAAGAGPAGGGRGTSRRPRPSVAATWPIAGSRSPRPTTTCAG
jgi:hypothetical protein